MPRLTIQISDTSLEHLARLAEQERRPTRDQAALLVERALLRRQPATERPKQSGRPQLLAMVGEAQAPA